MEETQVNQFASIHGHDANTVKETSNDTGQDATDNVSQLDHSCIQSNQSEANIDDRSQSEAENGLDSLNPDNIDTSPNGSRTVDQSAKSDGDVTTSNYDNANESRLSLPNLDETPLNTSADQLDLREHDTACIHDQSLTRDSDGVQDDAQNSDNECPFRSPDMSNRDRDNDLTMVSDIDQLPNKRTTNDHACHLYSRQENGDSSNATGTSKLDRPNSHNKFSSQVDVHFEDDKGNGTVSPSEGNKTGEPCGQIKNGKHALKYAYETDADMQRTKDKVPSEINAYCHPTTRDVIDQTERAIRPASPAILSPRLFIGRSGSPVIQSFDQSAPTIQSNDPSRVSPTPPLVEGATNVANGRQDGDDISIGSYQSGDSGKIKAEESKKLTKSQVLTFFSLAIATFLDQVSFSVLAPFFPREANEKGVSNLQVGFIFGAYALVNVIFSPIFGKFLPKLGAKFTFVSGIWLVAGCNILFGFCDELTSTTQFIIFCYVIRCTAAIGTAAGVTASMAIVANTFPDHVAQAVSLIETCSGLGYMVGPVIGGFLYEVSGGDYKMPFLILGGVDMLCVFINLALLPPIDCTHTKPGSITQFLRIPAVWPVGLVIFVSSGAFGFLDPTLSLHVEQYTTSAMVVGLLFLLAGGSYAFSSPFWGWVTEKFNIARLLVIIGTMLSGASFLLMGPSPLLNLPNELWIICLSLFFAGVFLSASILSSFNDFLLSALKHDLPDDISTQAIVSGLFNSLSALGNFVGPSVGGVAVDQFGFDWSVTVLAALQVGVAMLLAIFTLCEYCCQTRRRSTPLSTRVLPSVNREDLVQDSMEPLLKGQA